MRFKRTTVKANCGENENYSQDPCLDITNCRPERACRDIYGMFTRNRTGGQPQEYWCTGGVERKHLCSPLLSSWYVIGRVSTSHHGDRPTEFLPALGAGRWRAVKVGRKQCEHRSLESTEGKPGGRAGENGGWWREPM